ncbi:DNase I-like protein [Hymenopellis radicata]|nr:DNase I-like protein [Hymenopellis radicata]
MKGHGNLTGTVNNKWNIIHREMETDKVGVLALQETHSTDELIKDIHEMYGRTLKVFHSGDADDAGRRNGVAFVFNRRFTNVSNIDFVTVVPGRAILVRYPWHSNKLLTGLNVYAPSGSYVENRAFWIDLARIWVQRHLPAPDFLAGDTNNTEDPMDRSSWVADDSSVILALRRFRDMFGLVDGWRSFNPGIIDYTFADNSSPPSLSRLDRIYVSKHLLDTSIVWSIDDTTLNSDHRPVTVFLSDPDAPEIGYGRWRIPTYVVDNKQFIDDVQCLGLTFFADVLPDDIQQKFDDFENRIVRLAKEASRRVAPKLKKRIDELRSIRKGHIAFKHPKSDVSVTSNLRLQKQLKALKAT